MMEITHNDIDDITHARYLIDRDDGLNLHGQRNLIGVAERLLELAQSMSSIIVLDRQDEEIKPGDEVKWPREYDCWYGSFREQWHIATIEAFVIRKGKLRIKADGNYLKPHEVVKVGENDFND